MEVFISQIINIIIFILSIGVLVFIHEFGHYIVARIIDAKVEEFALGLGPVLYKKRIGETVYMIKLFPIGGYVKILGEMDETDADNPRSLRNKAPIKRIFVMLAGIFMNLLLASILYYIVLGTNQYKVYLANSFENFQPTLGQIVKEKISQGYIQYTSLVEGKNAEIAGMPKSGYIKEINGVKIEYSYQIPEIINSNKDSNININVCDSSECKNEKTYSVLVDSEGKIGISIVPNYLTVLTYENNKLTSGLAHGVNMIKLSFKGMSDIFAQAKSSGDYTMAVNTLSGPVGIFLAIDKVRQYGVLAVISLCADLSLVLGFMNLLPIPALDGGRVLLTLPELIIGRPINKKFEALIINISFILLLVLMFVVFVKDIYFFNYIKDLLN